MFFIIFVIFFALCAIHFYLQNDEKTKIFNKIIGPGSLPIIGNLFDFVFRPGQVKMFYFFRSLANKYNGVYRLSEFNLRHVNIYNPHDIGVILSSQKYLSKNQVYRFLHPWLNDGLLTSTGEKWQKRRKILTPAFHFNILKQFCSIFEEQSKILVEKLKKTNGEAVDILPYITNFALNAICETSMGTNLDTAQDSVQEYKSGIYTIGELLVLRSVRPWLHSEFIYKLSSFGKRQSKILKTLHDFTTNVIRERRKEKILLDKKLSVEDLTEENTKNIKKRLAMLDLLLSAESEGAIDEMGIREEVDTFMFEGHDTTTMGITFCLMLLANNPEAQNLAFEEVNSILNKASESISINDLNEMNYLERCIKEALRIFPSVPYIGRQVVEDIDMGDYILPAGSSCDIHIFDLHRDPKIYPNPLKFDPDRFLPENCQNRHPYAYIPFSAGPRNCIGQKFAILEEKAVISLILKNFILEPVTEPNDVYFASDLVLRSRDPVQVKFIPRKNQNAFKVTCELKIKET